MLASHLGMTVRELLRTTDARELQEWKAYNRHHPIDDAREDARAALICKTMADINRGKGQPAYRIDQFMPDYGKKHEKPSLRQQFVMMCAAKGIKMKKAG